MLCLEIATCRGVCTQQPVSSGTCTIVILHSIPLFIGTHLKPGISSIDRRPMLQLGLGLGLGLGSQLRVVGYGHGYRYRYRYSYGCG